MLTKFVRLGRITVGAQDGLALQRGRLCLWSRDSMWALYLDESGNSDAHSLPLAQGQTPVFTVAGLALPLDQWRDYDRDYLNLKRQFFSSEIDASSKPDTRWEIKGSNLIAPRNATSKRNKVFLYKVFDLIKHYEGKIFGCSFLKCAVETAPKASIYTKAVQILDERYDIFLREKDAQGIIILDSRMAHMKKGSGADYTVAVSHLSFIFGNEHGRRLKRIKEAPLFADSCLTAGLQIADLVAAQVYAEAYREKLAPEGSSAQWGYHDYCHTKVFAKPLHQSEFHSNKVYSGHQTHGIRIVDHRKNAAQPNELARLSEKYAKEKK